MSNAPPLVVINQAEAAERILNGEVCTYPWEWTEGLLSTWIRWLTDECTRLGIAVTVEDIPDEEMSIAYRAGTLPMPPTIRRQIALVRHWRNDRERERIAGYLPDLPTDRLDPPPALVGVAP
ncbi:hypothetical protein [Amycolatopsis sp. H20-H5]|uniref:hypothetical protein n=1 Tax=Amycolatopsis sp. H20-H5 TaxID=3046309 RepID=UPI002DB91878|nr:hypothetical protein [Amycolatopsis sp. H20-H5]MEC3977757.1 hypothetical protein [Amycolatopsis sp. H20-H5]